VVRAGSFFRRFRGNDGERRKKIAGWRQSHPPGRRCGKE
jgi:hypothetical protein